MLLLQSKFRKVLVSAYLQWWDSDDNNVPRDVYVDYQVSWMEKITCDYGFIITSPKFYKYYITLKIYYLICGGYWSIPKITIKSKLSINGPNIGNNVVD